MAKKFVYTFAEGHAEGNAKMKNLLGGKGAGLAEMARIGLPVPAGFTITTEVCTTYYQNDFQYPAGLEKQVKDALQAVEKEMDARFGDPENPLLVSCRSGARASMPGMMDTVLNIGLNDETVETLAQLSGDPRFAYDAYRRLDLHVWGRGQRCYGPGKRRRPLSKKSSPRPVKEKAGVEHRCSVSMPPKTGKRLVKPSSNRP